MDGAKGRAGKESKSGVIRLIAVFKLVKAALLVAMGIGALRLVNHGGEGALEHWIGMFGLKPGAHLVDEAITKIARLPAGKLKEVGAGSFLYAALFLTEGIGLWLMKPWAEWFTVVITASLVPVEVYEIVHHPSAMKVVVLVINVAVVVYLVLRIRNERAEGG